MGSRRAHSLTPHDGPYGSDEIDESRLDAWPFLLPSETRIDAVLLELRLLQGGVAPPDCEAWFVVQAQPRSACRSWAPLCSLAAGTRDGANALRERKRSSLSTATALMSSKAM